MSTLSREAYRTILIDGKKLEITRFVPRKFFERKYDAEQAAAQYRVGRNFISGWSAQKVRFIGIARKPNPNDDSEQDYALRGDKVEWYNVHHIVRMPHLVYEGRFIVEPADWNGNMTESRIRLLWHWLRERTNKRGPLP